MWRKNKRLIQRIKKPVYLTLLCAFLVCILYFLFNFLFIQRYLDWDQVFYSHNIYYALSPHGRIVFLSHHLHYQWGGKMFHQWMMKYCADSGFKDMVFNQRIRSLLAGSIGIFFAVLFLKNATGKLPWGVLGGILIGVCHGYLLYSTKVDTPIFPVAGMLATLWFFHKMEQTKKWLLPFSCIMGIVLFLDVMFHQYMAIICFACVLSLGLPVFSFHQSLLRAPISILSPRLNQIRQKPKDRFYAIIIITVLGGFLTFTAYFYASETIFNLPVNDTDTRTGKRPFHETSLQKWLFLYADYNRWGKGLVKFDFRQPVRGFTDAFISPAASQGRRVWSLKFLYDIDKPWKRESIPYNQLAYFIVFAFICLLFLFPFLLQRYRRTFLFILFSFIFLSLFITYWEAAYLEFWLIPCQLFCIIIILTCNVIAEKLKKNFGHIFHTIFSAGILVFILSLALYNIKNYVIPHTREQRLDYMDPGWEEDHYMRLFSTAIYRNPENPFEIIYK
ncbi:MAG: hypothetical protein JXB88_16115 [Spirochaetales bacterium]|nr:hypothetical protein [Spirochaetales bacterium]